MTAPRSAVMDVILTAAAISVWMVFTVSTAILLAPGCVLTVSVIVRGNVRTVRAVDMEKIVTNCARKPVLIGPVREMATAIKAATKGVLVTDVPSHVATAQTTYVSDSLVCVKKAVWADIMGQSAGNAAVNVSPVLASKPPDSVAA